MQKHSKDKTKVVLTFEILSTVSCVLTSCQRMALYTGFPVSLSHTIVVSRWLVIPKCATKHSCFFYLKKYIST
jgi:hypothetical protein